MAVLLQVLDMAGKLAWTGKLTAKAGNPAPNLWLDSLRKCSGQYANALFIEYMYG
jgi:hypothetical protein